MRQEMSKYSVVKTQTFIKNLLYKKCSYKTENQRYIDNY